MAEPIRVGVVGAGRFARRYHIPNFLRLPDVQVTAVCNRTLQSGQEVAAEFGIEHVYTDWRELVAQPFVDAVLVGTLPDQRALVTIAALEADKHVVAEAAFALDLPSAQAMYAASQARPHLKTLLSGMGIRARGENVMRQLLEDGFVGQVRQVVDYRMDGRYADPALPLNWRQSTTWSGVNFQFLGERAHFVRRWLGEHGRVLAQTRTFYPDRPGAKEEGQLPDAVNVLAELDDGTPVAYLHSGVTRLGGQPRLEIYGTEGTLVYRFDALPGAGPETILGARKDEDALRPIEIPEATASPPTINDAFAAMIRENARPGPEFSTFYDGLKYVEFLTACFQSAEQRVWVDLPLV
jgi:predicted dehydrogenase